MRLKRKVPEDGPIVDDYVPNSPKRPRQETGLPTIMEETMNVVPEVCPVEVPNDTPILEAHPFPTTLVITEPDADERAIVLYKPMTTSTYQPYHHPAFLQNVKGFQIPSGWSKALKHKLGYPIQGGSSNSNRLAVVPYMAPSTIIMNEDGTISGFAPAARSGSDSHGGSVIIEDITDQVRQEEEDAMQVEDAVPTPMECEGCEEMAVDSMQEFPAAASIQQQQFPLDPSQFAAPQFSTPTSWQMQSPPYTPVMWSS